MAYGRIIELVKRTQKTVFGDRAQTAWGLFVFGAVITLDSGYGIDLKDDLRAEMLAVADHFCHCALGGADVREDPPGERARR